MAVDPVAALARTLRAAPDPGWAGARGAVVSAVRGATRRSWPVVADTSDLGPPLGAVLVAEDVVRAELSRAVGRDGACAVAAVRLELDSASALVAVEVDVVARYGDDLRAVGPRVRAVVSATLRRLLGPGPGPDAVHVRVTDVVTGDPRSG